jgi:hypothetical protein
MSVIAVNGVVATIYIIALCGVIIVLKFATRHKQ